MSDSYLPAFLALFTLLVFMGFLLYSCRGPSCLIIFLLILLFVYFQNEFVVKEGSRPNNIRNPGNRYTTRTPSIRNNIRGFGRQYRGRYY